MRIHFFLILLTVANAQAADGLALKPTIPPVSMKSGVTVTDINHAVKPANDFFKYANGNGNRYERNPIPGDKSSWGAFDNHGGQFVAAPAGRRSRLRPCHNFS